MKCSQCQFENRESAKFCKECGANLELACSSCGSVYEPGSKFCDECGYPLARESQIDSSISPSEGERKHVTVLFSDLCGYTTISEKLDPEEIKEITAGIYSEVARVIDKYDGFVEKYAGDAVMVLFGADRSHEDDPVRAVKAAAEIHKLVETLSPRYLEKIGQSLQMHSGILSHCGDRSTPTIIKDMVKTAPELERKSLISGTNIRISAVRWSVISVLDWAMG